MTRRRIPLLLLAVLAFSACAPKVRITVVDPGHFHASLVLREHLTGVDDVVRVCAPDGDGLDSWSSSVERYNAREENPTSWKIVRETDLREASSGREIVVLAGDNGRKAANILEAVQKGYNVLSDKPMAITPDGRAMLESAYQIAREKGLSVMDLMTERHDEVNIALKDALAGHVLRGGSPENPGIVMESVHHFYKNVDGVALHRPGWYYDVRRQGEGIADVTTHLIDLIMWECFPSQSIDLSDVEVISASHFPTPISLEQFSASTLQDAFPDYLCDAVSDGVLQVFSNGRILFRIRELYAEISVRWDFSGGPDTFKAVYETDGGRIEVLQDASTGYSRRLLDSGRDITPPVTLTHEDHFALVMKDFLHYVRGKQMPDWESANTLAKYYITTTAVELASR